MTEVKLVIRSTEATEEQLKELTEWFKKQLVEQNSGGTFSYTIDVE